MVLSWNDDGIFVFFLCRSDGFEFLTFEHMRKMDLEEHADGSRGHCTTTRCN